MFIFLDTETTGAGPHDRLCQLAFKAGKGRAECALFNPGKSIAVEAMAVHHITNEMVKNKPAFKQSELWHKLRALVDDRSNAIVAHNAQFDVAMLNHEDIYPARVICTLKLARYLDKAGGIPKYSLQYLRYYLQLNVDAKAHDALGDITVLEALFKRIHSRFEKVSKDSFRPHGIKYSLTLAAYSSSLNIFSDFYRNRLKKPGPYADRVQESDLTAFIDFLHVDRRLNATTVNRYIVALRSFWQFVFNKGWHRRLLSRNIKSRRVRRGRALALLTRT